MNPNSGESSQRFEAPVPQSAEIPSGQSLEVAPTKSPENRPQSQSLQPSSQSATDIALSSQSVAQTFADDGVATDKSASTTTTASTDRIEKAWVDRAKAVLAATKSDPYAQKNQMSKVKAHYIKSRFNKTLKTDDSVG